VSRWWLGRRCHIILRSTIRRGIMNLIKLHICTTLEMVCSVVLSFQPVPFSHLQSSTITIRVSNAAKLLIMPLRDMIVWGTWESGNLLLRCISHLALGTLFCFYFFFVSDYFCALAFPHEDCDIGHFSILVTAVDRNGPPPLGFILGTARLFVNYL